MISCSSSFADVQADFLKHNISIDRPGFYDDPNFVQIERGNPEYLNNYARFVQQKKYDQAYLSESERIIEIVVNVFHEELVKDGRLGACVDVSSVISRILDELDVWNFVVSGALNIFPDPKTKINTIHLWPIDIADKGATAAHMWVFAPPFNIIDATIKQQPYKNKNVYRYLPDFILEKRIQRVSVGELDLCNPILLHHPYARKLIAENKEFVKVFPANTVRISKAQLKYVPFGIRMPDLPLEKITSLQLNGRSGQEIYNDLVKPRLDNK